MFHAILPWRVVKRFFFSKQNKKNDVNLSFICMIRQTVSKHTWDYKFILLKKFEKKTSSIIKHGGFHIFVMQRKYVILLY